MENDYSVDKPLNREPPVEDLVSSFITRSNGYDRNHGPIPHIDASEHIVHVDGAVQKPLELSVEQLRSQFPQHEVVCALSCAGNRRHTMRTLLKEVDGIDWGDGAIMNCIWRGPRLKDVLDKAGVNIAKYTEGHVAFACYQTQCQDDNWYGGSVELQRAMNDDAEIVLALEMNGKVLPTNNGYPVRVIVPGVSGCRSVKWLDRITVQHEESPNFYQRRDYKVLPPEAIDKETAAKYWDITPSLQDMPINSVIAVPQSGETIKLSPEGTIEVRGYAVPQGNHGPISKVEVSVDEGKTWTEAEIHDCANSRGKWCWSLWKATVTLNKGMASIYSRATDKGGNTQSSNPEWNLRGVAYNGYGDAKDITIS